MFKLSQIINLYIYITKAKASNDITLQDRASVYLELIDLYLLNKLTVNHLKFHFIKE
jgi:hypothetical protein